MKTFRDLKKSEIVSAIVLCVIVIAVLASMLADEAGSFSLGDAHDVAVVTAIVIFALLIPYLAMLLRSTMRIERMQAQASAQPKRVEGESAARDDAEAFPLDPAAAGCAQDRLLRDEAVDGIEDAEDADDVEDGPADQEPTYTRRVDPFELVRK